MDPPDVQTSLVHSVLLQAPVIPSGFPPFATDLAGRLIWYYPQLGAGSLQEGSLLLRPLPGGNMLLVANYVFGKQALREIDLAGNTVRETNSWSVSEQLQAMGEDPINGFHHDAVRLPNGHTLVLAFVERLVTVDGEEANVLADMVIDLDEDFQVAWVWNSRGQVWVLDEGQMTANLNLNLDLNRFTPALGAAAWLGDDHYHFSAAHTGDLNTHSLEFLSDGTRTLDIYSDVAMYRTFHMISLFKPTLEWAVLDEESAFLASLESESSADPTLWLDYLSGPDTAAGSGYQLYMPLVWQ